MKIWNGYSSEHSHNLVMIGYFKDASDAQKAKELIDRLINQVNEESNLYDGLRDSGPEHHRYTESMLDFLIKENLISLGPTELEQFIYEVGISVKDDKIIITTEEIEVSVFLKVLIGQGARVEVYSAHHYPETKY